MHPLNNALFIGLSTYFMLMARFLIGAPACKQFTHDRATLGYQCIAAAMNHVPEFRARGRKK